MINPKGGDPKKDIYVHSKVIVVDQAFCMLGSANHNERSMRHDSEDALAFRSSGRHNAVKQIQNQLLATVLSGEMPDSFDGKGIYEIFEQQLDFNEKNPNSPQSLVHRLEPTSGGGSVVIS